MGDACIGGHTCAVDRCNRGYSITDTKKCEKIKEACPDASAVTTEAKVCCVTDKRAGGVTYLNGPRAKCGATQFGMAKCRGFTLPEACEVDCLWPKHTAESCKKQTGCKYVKTRCQIDDSLFENNQKCMDDAILQFVKDEAAQTFLTTLGGCSPPITDMNEIHDARKKAAILATRKMTDGQAKDKKWNLLMDRAVGDFTKEEQDDQKQDRKDFAVEQMAKSCYTCLTSEETDAKTKASCKTTRLAEFLESVGKTGLTGDENYLLDTALKKAAADYAYEKRSGCKAVTDPTLEKQCRFNADAAVSFARCKLSSTGTEMEQDAHELENQALGMKCRETDKAGEIDLQACEKKRKEAFDSMQTQDSGNDDGNTGVQFASRMKDVAAEHLFKKFKACTIDFSTLEKEAASRKVCFMIAKKEYTQFDRKGATTMTDEEFWAIVYEKSSKQGTGIYSACFKSCQEQSGDTKNSCISECRVESIKSVAASNGENPDKFDGKTKSEKDAITREFKADTQKNIERDAAKKKGLCKRAAVAGVDCDAMAKAEVAERTGKDTSSISGEQMATADYKNEVDTSINAVKAFYEDPTTCTKTKTAGTAAEKKAACLVDVLASTTTTTDMDATGAKMFLDDVMHVLLKKTLHACRRDNVKDLDCAAAMTIAAKDLGIEVTQEELKSIVHAIHEEALMDESATLLDVADDYTEEDRMQDVLKIVKEKLKDDTLQADDATKYLAKAAVVAVQKLLNLKMGASEAAIKKAIHKVLGRVPTGEEVKKIKKIAQDKNMVEIGKAIRKLPKEERDQQFEKALRKNLETEDDEAIPPQKREEKRREIIDQGVQDLIKPFKFTCTTETSCTPQETTDRDAALKTWKADQIAKATEIELTFTGKASEAFEVGLKLEEQANKLTFDGIANMNLKGKALTEKQAEKLYKDHLEKTGQKKDDFQAWEMLSLMTEEAAKTDAVRAIMDDDANFDTPQAKLVATQAWILKKTGQTAEQVPLVQLKEIMSSIV